MLTEPVIVQAIKTYDDTTKSIADFIGNNSEDSESEPKHFSNALKGINNKYDLLHRTLLIEYSEFNEKFFEKKFNENHLTLNDEDREIMKSVNDYLGNITVQYSIHQLKLHILNVGDLLKKMSKKFK